LASIKGFCWSEREILFYGVMRSCAAAESETLDRLTAEGYAR
jgi:hypothetical protein